MAVTTDRLRPEPTSTVTVELPSTGSAATIIRVRGELDEVAGVEVTRLVERALMGAAPDVTLNLAGLGGSTTAGVAALSQAVAAGCRLPDGLRLVLGGAAGRDVLLAVCRWRSDQARGHDIGRRSGHDGK